MSFRTWRWTLPVLTIAAADLAIRWSQASTWSWAERLFYVASIALVLLGVRVLAALLPNRVRHPRAHWGACGVLGGFTATALLIHFDYFLYFGVQPGILALGHVVAESAEAWRVVQDEFSWFHVPAFLALLAAASFGWRIATDPRPSRRGAIVAGGLLVLLVPAFHLNVSMSPGNFLPSVNLIFTSSKAVHFALEGRGPYRRLQATSRIALPDLPQALPYNVLILVNESLRAQETSFNGYKRETTPRVDAFLKANPGRTFNFTSCYANSTKTSESVPSILTGVHPMEDYLKLHRFPLFYDYPEAFKDTYSFLFASHGYNVANFRFFLRSPRLDKMVYQENSGQPRFNSLGMDDRHLASLFRQVLTELPAERRFAGVLHFNGPHFPYEVPPEEKVWTGGTWQDDYDNSIRYQDKFIGDMLRLLAENGRLQNTIIFATSDHGEGFGEHGVNGHRYTFYEEIIHIPCWMHLPQQLADRHRVRLRQNAGLNVSNLDWVPTLVDLLDLKRVPEIAQLMSEAHGSSLVGPLDAERPILVQNGTDGQRLSDGYAVIKGTWRLLDHPKGTQGKIELYDLAKDGGERENLWNASGTVERRKWRNAIATFPVLARHASALLTREPVEPAKAPK